MTASKDYPGTDSSAQNLSYRLSICYDSNYGQHCDYLYIQRENIDAVIETLPAAVIKDLHTFADATVKLFDEAARILRPGGRFIISFSNRWFPAKAIQVWNNLHDFERIGLVMEYFIESAHFADINTCSLRGIPRPADDKHRTPLSDPVYVIWADRV